MENVNKKVSLGPTEDFTGILHITREFTRDTGGAASIISANMYRASYPKRHAENDRDDFVTATKPRYDFSGVGTNVYKGPVWVPGMPGRNTV